MRRLFSILASTAILLATAVTAISVALWIYAPLVAIAWSYPVMKAVEMLLPTGDEDEV